MQADAIEKLREQVKRSTAKAQANPLWHAELSDLEKMALQHDAALGPISGWKNPYPKTDPRSLLLEYQFAIFHDRSRAKLSLQARQTGKDFTSEGEAVDDCLARPGTQWMVAAPSERQALDSLEQGKVWAEAFDLTIEDYIEQREGLGGETLLKSAEIIFANKSRMRAVPGKPDTVRGRSANILLTEFDFFENPAATWKAILPSITNKLRGGEKKVRLITTPNGKGSATHKLWQKKGGKFGWSKWRVPIYLAALMGLDVDIEELREIFDDPDGWAQEFLVMFLDTASVLLPYELIQSCEDEACEIEINYERLRNSPNDFYLGIDIGRKKDLTVIWILEEIDGVKWTRGVKVFEKTPFREQLNWMVGLMSEHPKIRRAAIDATGIGAMLAEDLATIFGTWRAEECQFTAPFKDAIFTPLTSLFQDRRVRVPVSTVIREDLHGMNKIVTANGSVRYHAPSNEDGHCDRATALALANYAVSSIPAINAGPIPTGLGIRDVSNRYGMGRGSGRSLAG